MKHPTGDDSFGEVLEISPVTHSEKIKGGIVPVFLMHPPCSLQLHLCEQKGLLLNASCLEITAESLLGNDLRWCFLSHLFSRKSSTQDYSTPSSWRSSMSQGLSDAACKKHLCGPCLNTPASSSPRASLPLWPRCRQIAHSAGGLRGPGFVPAAAELCQEGLSIS